MFHPTKHHCNNIACVYLEVYNGGGVLEPGTGGSLRANLVVNYLNACDSKIDIVG